MGETNSVENIKYTNCDIIFQIIKHSAIYLNRNFIAFANHKEHVNCSL